MASENRSLGLREGCEAVIYRLSNDTIERLRDDGLEYLMRGQRPENENRLNPYSVWQETPGYLILPRADYGYKPAAFGATPLCGDEQAIVPYGEIAEAITRPGSYYAVTANGEGIIIIMPERGLAAFYYYG